MAIKAHLFLLSLVLLSSLTLCLSYRFDQQQEGQQQCQQRCQQQEQSQAEQKRCQQRCQQEHQQQDPQCQKQCRQEQSPERRSRCEQRCQQEQQQQDPQCQKQCRQEQSPERKSHCEQRCQQEQQQQQQEQQDPQRQSEKCQRECQQEKSSSQQRRCQQSCQEKMREQQQQQCQHKCQQQHQSPQKQTSCEQRCQEEQQQQQEQKYIRHKQNNPFFFDRESFVEVFKSEQGSSRELPRFSKQSYLLQGIDNYRVAIHKANPHTFVMPSHFDAEAVFYVIRGNGVITVIQQENKQSYNLQRGDVIRVRAGSTIYLINKDNRESLSVAQLLQPVSVPGQYRPFFPVGERSYYREFSNDVLQAALNAPSQRIERLFGQQKQAVIVKASQEQIRGLSRHASQGGRQAPWGGSQSSGPYNMLNKRPLHSNKLGKLYQVDQDDYKQLQELDVFVSVTNITKGAMTAPFYNSRATVVVLVVEGRGRFEMISPHLSRRESQSQRREEQQEQQQQEGGEEYQGRQEEQQQEQEQSQGQQDIGYQRFNSRISKRTAFVIPAGHPTTIIADDNESVQLVAFGINAQNNERNYLAGKNNILNQMENEAKELSFNMPAREVDSILNNQDQQYFLPGPNQRQQSQEGQHDLPLDSIFNFAGF